MTWPSRRVATWHSIPEVPCIMSQASSVCLLSETRDLIEEDSYSKVWDLFTFMKTGMGTGAYKIWHLHGVCTCSFLMPAIIPCRLWVCLLALSSDFWKRERERERERESQSAESQHYSLQACYCIMLYQISGAITPHRCDQPCQWQVSNTSPLLN